MKKNETHDMLCLGLHQIYLYKSTGKMTTAMGKFPEGINKQRAQKWLEIFAPIVMVSEHPLTYKMADKKVLSFEDAKLKPYWKMEIGLPDTSPLPIPPLTIKTEGVRALKAFFADPSDTNYDKVINLMSFYKRYSNHPMKKANVHKSAIHLQAGAPGLKS